MPPRGLRVCVVGKGSNRVITPFIYQAQPSRVIFGCGSLDRLPEEVDRLGSKRALLLATPGRRRKAEELAARLGQRASGIYSQASMHVPIEIAEAARLEARRLGADCAIALGGGSTIGLAKAIALDSGLPILAIPTTYAGSEMTSIWGLTRESVKDTGSDKRVLPQTVIYDPLLTMDLPASVSGPSGINALAHCVEALYAPETNPIVGLMAEEGIRALAASLPVVVTDPTNLEARTKVLYGAWLAGSSLGAVSMGLHHKLCHTLGGRFNLPHADVHTIVLPHATRYNRAGAPGAMRRVATVLGATDAATGIYDLAVAVGARTALRDLGMRREELEEAADLAVLSPYTNPMPVTRDGVRALLEDAYYGRRPQAEEYR